MVINVFPVVGRERERNQLSKRKQSKPKRELKVEKSLRKNVKSKRELSKSPQKAAKSKGNLDESLKRLTKKIPKTWMTDPSILLCPNIPKPMHGVAPRNIMGTKWWNATRQAAYKSTAYHCEACSVHKLIAKGRQWLEGHELYDVDYQRGRMTYVRAVPLCYFCHNYIHDGRLNSLLAKKEIHHAKYTAIIQHGDEVLRSAGLKRPSYKEREDAIIESLLQGKLAAWGDWRLVFDGKEYPPKFKTEYQWRKAMQ